MVSWQRWIALMIAAHWDVGKWVGLKVNSAFKRRGGFIAFERMDDCWHFEFEWNQITSAQIWNDWILRRDLDINQTLLLHYVWEVKTKWPRTAIICLWNSKIGRQEPVEIREHMDPSRRMETIPPLLASRSFNRLAQHSHAFKLSLF